MIESQKRVREIISEEIMLARLGQSEQMRAFFIEMWKQNPSLAKQGGARVKNLMTPLESVYSEVGLMVSIAAPITSKQRGVSLIELIMFIVIVSSAMVGILTVMNVVSRNNADPVMHKQALAIAESLLEEIELQNFSMTASGALSRATYQNVMDYNNYSENGIVAADGTTIGVLSGYSAIVTVTSPSAWNGITAGNWVMITVKVTPPSGDSITSVGYRTNY